MGVLASIKFQTFKVAMNKEFKDIEWRNKKSHGTTSSEFTREMKSGFSFPGKEGVDMSRESLKVIGNYLSNNL